MSQETFRTIAMAAGIIGLAALAAWMGLAHGCDKPATSGVIAGQVRIGAQLADKVAPTDVLFVIVRRPGGPPRPLAVKRIDSPQFPVPFEITNRDMMMEGSELRGMVEIIARLDKDGVAGPAQPGDLEGRFDKNPTLPGATNVDIVIDQAL